MRTRWPWRLTSPGACLPGGMAPRDPAAAVSTRITSTLPYLNQGPLTARSSGTAEEAADQAGDDVGDLCGGLIVSGQGVEGLEPDQGMQGPYHLGGFGSLRGQRARALHEQGNPPAGPLVPGGADGPGIGVQGRQGPQGRMTSRWPRPGAPAVSRTRRRASSTWACRLPGW